MSFPMRPPALRHHVLWVWKQVGGGLMLLVLETNGCTVSARVPWMLR